jgi:hypothetical protein
MKTNWQFVLIVFAFTWLGYNRSTTFVSAIIFPQVTFVFFPFPLPETIGFFPTRTKRLIHSVSHPNAVFITLNIAQINLFPGDRVVIRTDSGRDEDSLEGSSWIILTKSNQSDILNRVNTSRRNAKVWEHPLFLKGNTIKIEYFPSFYSQRVAMFGQKKRQDAVLIITSYTFGLDQMDNIHTSSNIQEEKEIKVIQESILDGMNEAKEAICYKKKYPKIYQKSQAVARLYLQKENKNLFQMDNKETTTWYFCTGWLVGKENHLLTNYHCVFDRMSRPLVPLDFSNEQQYVNQTINIELNFMAETSSCQEKGTIGEKKGKIEATSATIVAYDEKLDYALLMVHPTRAKTNLSKKYGFLTLRAKGPKALEDIYIPQHPRGEPKEIAVYKNGVPAQLWVSSSSSSSNNSASSMDQEATVFYNADTQPGSSGSPVLSRKDHTVVALHHAGGGLGGFASRKDSSLGGGGSDVNYGLRIDSIIRDLKAKKVLPPCAVASSKNKKKKNNNKTIKEKL